MTSVERLSLIVDGIYAAAEDALKWPAVLEAISEELGTGMVVLLAVGGGHPAANVAADVRADPDAITLYNAEWGAHDPWLQTGHPSLDQPGAIVDGREMLDDRSLVRSVFYNEFYARFDLFQAMVATLRADGARRAGLSLHYPDRGRGELKPHSRALLAMLVPHFQRALQISERLAGLTLERDASVNALDHLTVGVVLIGANGRPLFVNQAGRALAGSRDGIRIERDGVHAERRPEDVELQKLIGDALATSTTAVGRGGGVLAVSRPSGSRALNVVVAPLRRRSRSIDGEYVAAAVFVSDPDDHPHDGGEMLRRLYGLTPTEGRVTTLLLEGLPVRGLAERLDVSENTVRTHLKRIFDKTATRTQAGLVRLLLASVGKVRLGER